MAKRSLSVFAVTTADWMKYRPYKHFSPQYDGFYLQLANRVFEEINHPDRFFKLVLKREQQVELAVVLCSWLEDYANEIGLWSTFVRKNQELYGYALPFFDLNEYDPETINPEDLAYLCWHYCCKTGARFIAPDSPGILEFGYLLTDMFDEALDEAPGTDFYDEFLRIPENIPFFELKGKLNWLSFKSYLCGPEFNHIMTEDVEELIAEQKAKGMDLGYVNKLIYSMQDDFHYKKSSSFLAFTMPEWLAEVALCHEPLRDDIRKLFERVLGEFVYEGNEGPYYLFRYHYTKRLFKVRQESVEVKGIPTGDLIFTSLVCWRGEWWVSGTLASFGNAKTVMSRSGNKIDPASISYYAYTEAQQQQLREMTADQESAHLEFFGDRLVIFKNEREMQAALQKQREHYNKKISKSGKKDSSSPSDLDRFKSDEQENLDVLDLGKGLAVFFRSGEGVSISSVLPLLAHHLTKRELSEQESRELFFNLFTECDPESIKFLLGKYGAKNLVFPVKTQLAVMPYLEFLMRFYNPGDFREVLPNSTLMLEG